MVHICTKFMLMVQFSFNEYSVHTVLEAGSSTITIKEARTGKKVTPTPGPFDSQSLTEDDQKHLCNGIMSRNLLSRHST